MNILHSSSASVSHMPSTGHHHTITSVHHHHHSTHVISHPPPIAHAHSATAIPTGHAPVCTGHVEVNLNSHGQHSADAALTCHGKNWHSSFGFGHHSADIASHAKYDPTLYVGSAPRW